VSPRIATRVLLLLLAAAASAETAAARTRPPYGGTLRVETQRDLWQGPEAIGRLLTMDGLTRIDEDGTVRPALAAAWSSQGNDHRWEFRLRGTARFHDGSPLTAEAVAASLAASCGESCPWKSVRAAGQSVVVVGDSPLPELPAQLARAEFLISRPMAGGGVDGTGPFVASETAEGATGGAATDSPARFAANDDYWGGRPFLDAVEVRAKRSVRDQWLDQSIGRADIVEVPSALLRTAQQQHLRTLTSAPADLLALQIAANGALANEKLREAVALAVDRNALFNVIFQKQGEITASLLPGGVSGYSFLFPTDRNLDRAAELRGGAAPQIALAPEEANAELQLTVERIAINLREAGFRAQVLPANDRARADIVLRRIPLEAPDALAAIAEFLESSGSSVAIGGADAEAVYNAERDLLARHTLVPLLYLPRSYAVSERVRDLRVAPNGRLGIADAAINNASMGNANAANGNGEPR